MQADRSSLNPVLQLGGYQAGESDSYIADMQRYSRSSNYWTQAYVPGNGKESIRKEKRPANKVKH
ncbi:unnamed protein product [Callosobruchus maculatus]|uniref:Uncharacterized protein n=1 Tax=Callosobruchus maculatus TaxID=64391 RepID=A0A653CH80_CALMS|nr:unnamed protein product [Callosobruchus maculatus]